MNSNPAPGPLSVVVTGGSSGIGLATVQSILERGGNAVVIDLDVTRCDDLLRRFPGRLQCFTGDVADEARLKDILDVASSASKIPLSGLVTCAGIAPIPAPIEDTTVEAWSRVLESHLTGTYICCRVFGAAFARSSVSGSIVTLASVLAHRPGPVLAYGAAKSGILSLTESLAAHWAARGVRVNAVAPGWTDTPFVRRKGRTDKDFQSIIDATPQARLLDPAEIAEVILFLLSPASSAVTGSTINCDGGYVAGSGWAPYGGFPRMPAGGATFHSPRETS
ncbi:SDR family oxidoreductase [Caballeronia sp. LZ035]|uniref:SDR family NAD(P)-dependent oxidoreductase n=1 Tax=Caballeronia sp. LZ035 TaxID=3038568 RepID=UPI002858A3D9|nr:SDR family oxidoreductase [Caballeronia sp. LZ035]MDR5761327.1 SDR family NAD(P)-dependent oxidoreductase [Caballeronia sp. LZ035]